MKVGGALSSEALQPRRLRASSRASTPLRSLRGRCNKARLELGGGSTGGVPF